MNRTKIVSVITMTYRNYNGIYKTIDSVLTQKYPSIEYIIADDGSGNFPLSQIKNYINLHKKENIINVKYIIRENNVGTVSNLDDAYRRSIGDILMPLSCGDMFINDKTIDEIVQEFQINHCKALVTSRLVCDNNGNELYLLPHFSERKKIASLFSKGILFDAFISGYSYDFASGCALYIEKEYYINSGGFDKNFILWEDGPFIARTLIDEMLSPAMDLITIKYSLGGISNSKTINPIMHKDILNFHLKIINDYLNNIKEPYKRMAIYSNNRANCENKYQLLILYIFNIRSLIFRVLYLLKRKLSARFDKLFLYKNKD